MPISEAWREVLELYRKRFESALKISKLSIRNEKVYEIKHDYYNFKEVYDEDFVDCGWNYIVSGGDERFFSIRIKEDAIDDN